MPVSPKENSFLTIDAAEKYKKAPPTADKEFLEAINKIVDNHFDIVLRNSAKTEHDQLEPNLGRLHFIADIATLGVRRKTRSEDMICDMFFVELKRFHPLPEPRTICLHQAITAFNTYSKRNKLTMMCKNELKRLNENSPLKEAALS